MEVSIGFVRVDLDGPDGRGLDRLELDQASFQSDLPTQHYYEFYSSENDGLAVGVWDTTSMQEVFGPYPTDEFIIVFEGAFELVGEAGKVVGGRAGQAAFIPVGTPISWKQTGYLRKVYVTLRPSMGAVPSRPTLDLTKVIDPTDRGVPGRVDAFDQDDEFLVGSADGRMTLWKIESGEKQVHLRSSSSHQLIHVLGGALELEAPNGETTSMEIGHTVFIPRGLAHGWIVRESLTAYLLQIETSAT